MKYRSLRNVGVNMGARGMEGEIIGAPGREGLWLKSRGPEGNVVMKVKSQGPEGWREGGMEVKSQGPEEGGMEVKARGPQGSDGEFPTQIGTHLTPARLITPSWQCGGALSPSLPVLPVSLLLCTSLCHLFCLVSVPASLPVCSAW